MGAKSTPRGSRIRKGAKGTRVADDSLSVGIQELLTEVRSELGSFGWTIHVERRGKRLTFEFRNPLSPLWTGWTFDEDRPLSELREELTEQLTDPELVRTKSASPPRRKRELIGGLRWAATSYGWSDSVFREVIDTLRRFRVLAGDESGWLKTVGAQVLPPNTELEWQKRVRDHEDDRAIEQYTSYVDAARRDG